MASALELLRELERDAVHAPQHQHVEVLHRHVGLAAERADRDALHDDDHALAVRRDALGVCGQRGSGGNALSVAAEAMPQRSAPSSRARGA